MTRVLMMLLVSLTTLTFVSCGGDNEDIFDNRASEVRLQEYFAQQGIMPTATGSGLYYIIEEEGSEEKPTSSSEVLVHYEGRLLDGTKFDSSYDRGDQLAIRLNRVIAGWTEGIQLFGRGGKGTLYIPSELAYGSNSPSPLIPPNSPLVFDIELFDFR